MVEALRLILKARIKKRGTWIAILLISLGIAMRLRPDLSTVLIENTAELVGVLYLIFPNVGANKENKEEVKPVGLREENEKINLLKVEEKRKDEALSFLKVEEKRKDEALSFLKKEKLTPELQAKLLKLLAPSIFAGRLAPEAAIQKTFVDELRYLTLNGELKCIWSSIPNDNSSNKKPLFGSMLKATGKIAGAPDMLFMWSEGCGFIEFKAGRNVQSAKQKVFEEWCGSCDVKYRLAYSKDEAFDILREWGVIYKLDENTPAKSSIK